MKTYICSHGDECFTPCSHSLPHEEHEECQSKKCAIFKRAKCIEINKIEVNVK